MLRVNNIISMDQYENKTQDEKLTSPSADRNKDPIKEVLQRILPNYGSVLEISSGSGQHAIHFAPLLLQTKDKDRQWLPSDIDSKSRNSIKAWTQFSELQNIAEPLDIDVRTENWRLEETIQQTNITAIININMIHIAEWECCIALMKESSKILPKDGILYFYGPFFRRDIESVESNIAFDSSLKNRNSKWGIRQLEEVIDTAQLFGFSLKEIIEMPANNLSVIFNKN